MARKTKPPTTKTVEALRHPRALLPFHELVEGTGAAVDGAQATSNRYFTATGLQGDPTPPVNGSGGPANRNSQTPSAAQSMAKSSR